MAGGVEDCVRSHIAWMTAKADARGGIRGRHGGVDWAWVPAEHTVHLLFPERPSEPEIRAVTTIADELGARSTALWSAEDHDRAWLEDLGFEQGWQPWWMTAAPDEVPAAVGDRVTLVQRARDHDPGMAGLVSGDDAFLAEAHVRGHYAGRAWLHVDRDVAGIYDMAVWPPFQRRGLGREMLATLAAEAGRRGARVITLNATPQGCELYRTCGLRLVGEGCTWWRHDSQDDAAAT